MIMRGTNYYDDKGITEPLQDIFGDHLHMVHYLARNPTQFM